MTKTHGILLDAATIAPIIDQFLIAPAGISGMNGTPSPINRKEFIELLLEDLNNPDSLSYKANLYMQSQVPTETVSPPGADRNGGKNTFRAFRKVTPLYTLNMGFNRLKSIIEDPSGIKDDMITADLEKIKAGLTGLSLQIGKMLEISLSEIKTDAEGKPVTFTDLDPDLERTQLELYKKQLDDFIPAFTRAAVGVTSAMRGKAQNKPVAR